MGAPAKINSFPSLPCITQDENDEPHQNNEYNSPLQPRYSLRSRANIIANSVIIEEPTNVTNFNPARKLGKPPVTEKNKLWPQDPNQYVPPYLANAIVCPDTGKELEYRHLIKSEKHKKVWSASFAKELQQLAQGNEKIKGTNKIRFIKQSAVPNDRTVTYGRICVNYRPQKADPYRTRLAVGGDRLDYPWDKSCPTAGLQTSKILFNSVISTKNAKFFGIDIAHLYLCTPLDRYEYMQLPIGIIPDEIIDQYNLR